MKASEVYLRAAELVSESIETSRCWYSCIAIREAAAWIGNEYPPETDAYVALFADDMDELQEAIGYGDARELRIMLLLLASAIAASEERSRK